MRRRRLALADTLQQVVTATSGIVRLEPPDEWAAGGTHPMTLERDSLGTDGSTVRPDLGGGLYRWSEDGGFGLLEPLPTTPLW
jgi:hypothetical protein